ILGIVAVWPQSFFDTVVDMLDGHRDRSLVLRAEILIHAEIDLVPVHIRAGSLRRFGTVFMTRPAESGGVQAVARRIVIRKGHAREQRLKPSRFIESGSERIIRSAV